MCRQFLTLSMGVLLAASVRAQVAPFQSSSVSLVGLYNQAVALPMGPTPVQTNLVIDATSAGGDTIDAVAGDPAVVISLVNPAGTQINAGNASMYGFTFSTYTSDGTQSDVPSLYSTAGTHTVIQFPPGQVPGTYQVQADTSLAASDTGMLLTYYPSSTVQAGAVTDSTVYRLGDSVILSGLLFDGTTPIQSATITATAVTFLPIQATVGNYQLISQQTLTATTVLNTYSVQLINTGPAATRVSASVTSSDPNTLIQDGLMLFGDVAAGSSTTSFNTFSVQIPTSSTFDPSVLTWQISTPSTPIQISLLDSGTYDATTGDGIYTGVLTPSLIGSYTVFVTATGNSSSGVAFSRTATTTFQVNNPTAEIGTLQDAPLTDSNGNIYSIAVTAPLTVQVAGQYQFTLSLQGSNGNVTQAVTSGQLNTGNQQLVVAYSPSNLLELGVDGPYAETNASLVLTSSSVPTLADYVGNAGMTQAYKLSSVVQSVLTFTG